MWPDRRVRRRSWPRSRGCSKARPLPARRSSPSRRWMAAGSRRCGTPWSTCVTRRSGVPPFRRTAGASSVGVPGARLAIDRVFAVKGRGVVVTGTLRGRGIGHDATLRLVPGDRTVRVREIQVHGAAVDRAEPGRTALNLAGVDPGELHRGIVLTDDAIGRGQRPGPRRPARRPARSVAGAPACRDGGGRGEHRPERPGRARPARRVCARDASPGRPDRGRAGRSGRPPAIVRRGTGRRSHRARRRATTRDLAPPSDGRARGAARDGGRNGRSRRDRGGQAGPPRRARTRERPRRDRPRRSRRGGRGGRRGGRWCHELDRRPGRRRTGAPSPRHARSGCGGIGRGRPGR